MEENIENPKEELYLCFMHKVGVDYKQKNIYDLIFTDDLDNVNDDEFGSWEHSPAYTHAKRPSREYIKKICRITTDMEIVTLTDEEYDELNFSFSLYDACDGVIALGWEKIGSEKNGRFIFKFGAQYSELNYYLGERNEELVRMVT